MLTTIYYNCKKKILPMLDRKENAVSFARGGVNCKSLCVEECVGTYHTISIDKERRIKHCNKI